MKRNGGRFVLFGCLLALAINGSAGMLTAQRVAVAGGTEVDTRDAMRVLDTRITITLKNVTIREAIDSLARVSQAKIAYRSDVLAQFKHVVDVAVKNEALGSTLSQLLRGTILHVEPAGEGRLAVVVDPTRPATGDQTEVGTLVGQVVHAQTKQPIADATVIMGSGQRSITTDTEGKFRISVEAGQYTMTFRALGFQRASQTVTVTSGKTTTLEVVLEPSASVLDEVIVTGTVVATERKMIPTPITVIKAEELERRGITRIEQLFRGEVPGVFASDEGIRAYESGSTIGEPDGGIGNMAKTDIYVRGSSNMSKTAVTTPLKTYVDGVELLDASALGTIDPQSIDRIEIITGPQAATIYGSGAMGGVMQIFTKKGYGNVQPELTLRLGYGLLQNNFTSGLTPTHTHTANVTGGFGAAVSYAGTLTYNYTGQWKPRLFSQRVGGTFGITHTRGPLRINGSVSMTLGRNGTNRGGVTAGPIFVSRVESGVWEGRFTTSIEQRTANNSSQNFSFSANYRANSWWQHSITVGRNQTTFNLDAERPLFNTPSDTLYQTEKASGNRTTMSYNTTLSPSSFGLLSSTLTVGGNGSFGEQIRLEGCHPLVDKIEYIDCYPSLTRLGLTPPAARGSKTHTLGAFASWRLGIFDRVYTALGVRAERNPNYGGNYKVDWTPTNGITYTEHIGSVSIKLMGSYGRATRAPLPEQRELQWSDINNNNDPNQYITTMENLKLRPEYSRGPQGGIELYFGNRGSLSINRYHQEVTDLIARVIYDYVPYISLASNREYERARYQYQNIGTVINQGWESTGSWVMGPVTLKGTYSWNDSRMKHAIGSYVAGQTFLQLPSHMGNVTMTYAHAGTTMTVVSNWIGAANYQREDGLVYQDALRCRECNYIDKSQYTGAIQFASAGYTKTDISVLHRLTSWASATVHVVNAGNSFISDKSFFNPTLGRQTTFGLSMRFPR